METGASTEENRPSPWDSCLDFTFGLVTKFCSLVVTLCMFTGVLVYLVGVAKLTHSWGSMERLVVAHFVAMLSSVLGFFGYLYLFLKGQKQVQFMSFLTVLLIVSFMLVAHSVGVATPSVIDCGTNFTDLALTFGQEAGGIANDITNRTLNKTIIHDSGNKNIGSYSQSLVGCHDQSIVLGGAIVTGFFQLVAVFDVQRVLLRRVRAKSYGERFTEMGIR